MGYSSRQVTPAASDLGDGRGGTRFPPLPKAAQVHRGLKHPLLADQVPHVIRSRLHIAAPLLTALAAPGSALHLPVFLRSSASSREMQAVQ